MMRCYVKPIEKMDISNTYRCWLRLPHWLEPWRDPWLWAYVAVWSMAAAYAMFSMDEDLAQGTIPSPKCRAPIGLR